MSTKTKYAQLAAVAALAVLFGANAGMTTAQAQGNLPTLEKKQDGQTAGSGDQRRKASPARAIKREGSSTLQKQSDRPVSVTTQTSPNRVTAQTTVRRDRDNVRANITIRDRDRDRFHRRGHESFAAFVILGPRHHYRSGWCRGLHRGYHWAPGVGRHAGRHFGLFRC